MTTSSRRCGPRAGSTAAARSAGRLPGPGQPRPALPAVGRRGTTGTECRHRHLRNRTPSARCRASSRRAAGRRRLLADLPVHGARTSAAVVDGAARGGRRARHITMGGHYPSFDPRSATRIPGLDSVVRFEGELTLVELLACLERGRDWRRPRRARLPGSTTTPTIVVNEHRRSVEDLDALPLPDRSDIDYEHQQLPTASMLGSRGCPWNCSFCSIRPFYEAPGRRAAPAAPARGDGRPRWSICTATRGVVAFLFQDDDFLADRAAGARLGDASSPRRSDAASYAGRSRSRSAAAPTRSTKTIVARLISRRPDARLHGRRVGRRRRLRHMSKQLKPEAHLAAGRILKQLGCRSTSASCCSSPYTRSSIRPQNIDFLEEFVGDGWTVAPFCRTLPYAGTPIAAPARGGRRACSGRRSSPTTSSSTRGSTSSTTGCSQTFHTAQLHRRRLCHILRCSLFEAHLRMPGANPVIVVERSQLHLPPSPHGDCNRVACYTLRAAIDHIERTPLADLEVDRGLPRRPDRAREAARGRQLDAGPVRRVAA